MSLVSTAMRICAVRALTGATLAGSRVFDSEIDPARLATESGEPAPIIVIYTADETGKGHGADLTSSPEKVDFLIHLLVAGQATANGQEDAGEIVSHVIPETDSGLEITLDLLERQVFRVLQSSLSPYAEMWRLLKMGEHIFTVRRGASSKEGQQRFAAHEISISTGTIADPPLAGPRPPIWQKVIDLFEADDNEFIATVGKLIARECSGEPATLSQQAVAALGLPASWAEMIGLDPVLPTPAPDLALEEVTLEDQDLETDQTLGADEAAGFEVPLP